MQIIKRANEINYKINVWTRLRNSAARVPATIARTP